MKEYAGPSIFCAVLLLGIILVSLAVADMKKVDEGELARANASVSGTPVKERRAGIVKDTVRQDMTQASTTFAVQEIATVGIEDILYSPSEIFLNRISGLRLNIKGQEIFMFYHSEAIVTTTGGITSVTTH